MTKKVRIENADTASYRVAVDVYQKDADGNDVLQETRVLANPADLGEFTLRSGRHLVVREATA